jgi:hypothetical protein
VKEQVDVVDTPVGAIMEFMRHLYQQGRTGNKGDNEKKDLNFMSQDEAIPPGLCISQASKELILRPTHKYGARIYNIAPTQKLNTRQPCGGYR